MATKTINQLPAAVAALGAMEIEVDSAGVSQKITITQLIALLSPLFDASGAAAAAQAAAIAAAALDATTKANAAQAAAIAAAALDATGKANTAQTNAVNAAAITSAAQASAAQAAAIAAAALDATTKANAAQAAAILLSVLRDGSTPISGTQTFQSGIAVTIGDVVLTLGNLQILNGSIAAPLGDILTGDPGGGSGAWKIGTTVAGAVAPDAANYVEVEINGGVVKLIKAA